MRKNKKHMLIGAMISGITSIVLGYILIGMLFF